MARLVVELKEDVGFDEGQWQSPDARLGELAARLAGCCGRPERLFSRAPAALDRERVAIHPDDPLPDLNLFYLVDGDRETIAREDLVADVSELEPTPEPVEEVPEGVASLDLTTDRPLADAIDLGAAPLGHGEILIVPLPISGRAAWAAAELAARRGVRIIAPVADEVPGWVHHIVFAPPGELAGVARGAARRLGIREGKIRLTLESVLLAEGGDLGGSELYLEGWVEEDGERTPFRVPQTGAVKGVRRGDTVELHVVVYRGVAPASGPLRLHVEVWEEDLGKHSLLDPDDLLGIHEVTYSEEVAWGEGLHEDVVTGGGEGVCQLTYRVELVAEGR